MAFLVLIGAIAVIAWWVELQRHPIRTCPGCNGAKKNTGDRSSTRWGVCRRCGGKGYVRRFGAGKK